MKSSDRYEEIVRQYSEALYWHIRRIVVCHEDAQDILQDTLSSIFLNLWQLKDPEKTKAWMYKIATNKCLRFLKKKAKELNMEDISEHLCNSLSEGAYVDYNKAAAIDLHKAILKLPKTQQIVFNLRFYDELGYAQISKITGVSIDSLRVNYHIAKSKVTKYLHEEQL